MEYTERCCLNDGVYTLKCQDSYGDGWHGGFIEVRGTEYCEDFTGGSDKSIQIPIGETGKYHFSQIRMLRAIKYLLWFLLINLIK